jgi:hypothetical protein
VTDRAAIEAALARRDYPALLDAIDATQTDAALARTRRFAANMLALRDRDPALAAEVESAPTTGRVRLVTTPDGADSLALADQAGVDNPLCPGGTRHAALEHAAAELRRRPDAAQSIALAGVGDGAVLTRFAAEPPDMLGRQRVVYVIEPDAEVFRSAMLLCDWSGDAGPLRSGRFRLAVGADWAQRVAEDIAPDSRLPPPRSAVRLCRDPRPIAAALQQAADAVRTEITERRRRLDEAYRGVTPAQIAARLRAVEGARVLLLTTRYSTVLQHSTRDFARAAEALGAHSRVVIEDEPWQQHMIASLLGEVLGFRPDLVLQIDHHRHETPGVFPDIVPFVCVIQDNLPNLMSRGAVTKLGPLDFATGAWVRRYVLDFGYPEPRCIEIPRLTPEREADITADRPAEAPDLLYVSNHSADPAEAVERTAASLEKTWPEGAAIVRAAGPDLIARYAEGGCVEDELDLAAFIADACARHGLRPPPPDRLTSLTDTVNVAINNPLYRQQGLRWAVDAAESLGLTLALHGKGWEGRPDFARVARGFIDYRDLPEATRNARFCLTLEPYFPTQHQRALDTWMWGGLPLIRRRRRETRQLEFNAWIDRLPDSVRTLDDALAALGEASPSDAHALREAHEHQQRLHAWDGEGDLIALYRERADDGVGDLMDLPPRFDEIAFGDRAELVATIRRLLEDEPAADDIRRAQHEWVRPRFSYERGVERILRGVAARTPGAG